METEKRVATEKDPVDLEAKLERFANAVRAGAEHAHAFIHSGFEWTSGEIVDPGNNDETGTSRAGHNEHAEACFREFAEATAARTKVSKRDEALNRLLAAAVRSLRAYQSIGNWPRGAGPLAVLPRDIARLAESIIEDLTSGRIAEPVKELYFKRGKNSRGALENWAVRSALVYYWSM